MGQLARVTSVAVLALCLAPMTRATAATATGAPATRAPQAAAAPDPARQALLQMSAAVRALPSARYRARAVISLALENRTGRVEGTVDLPTPGRGRGARVDAVVQLPGATESARNELRLDGPGARWIDHAARTWSSIDAARICDRPAGALLAAELLDSAELEALLASGELRDGGTSELGGEPCRDVRWTSSDGRADRRWIVSERDHLPRQIERSRKLAFGETERVRTTILAWESAPAASPAAGPPAGYTERSAPEPEPSAPSAPAPDAVDLSSSLAPLVRRFDEQSAKPRVLALLAPSCTGCLRAGRALRVGLLEALPEADLEVLVVWVTVFQADGPAAVARAAEILPDPRVRHFVDGKRLVGRAVAPLIGMPAARDVMAKWGSTREQLLRVHVPDYLDGPATAYDALLFYEPGSRWGASLPAPARWVTAMDPEMYTGLDRANFFWGDALVARLTELGGELCAATSR